MLEQSAAAQIAFSAMRANIETHRDPDPAPSEGQEETEPHFTSPPCRRGQFPADKTLTHRSRYRELSPLSRGAGEGLSPSPEIMRDKAAGVGGDRRAVLAHAHPGGLAGDDPRPDQRVLSIMDRQRTGGLIDPVGAAEPGFARSEEAHSGT